MENDSRYPYTYACDYLRGLAGYGEGGTKLSRSDASQVRQGIADALGMADDELARKLADHYKANQDALTKKSCEAFARAQAWPNAKSQATDAALSRQVACTDGLCHGGTERTKE